MNCSNKTLIIKIIFQIPAECVHLPPLAPIQAVDVRLLAENVHRPEPDKTRQNVMPNQYVEIII